MVPEPSNPVLAGKHRDAHHKWWAVCSPSGEAVQASPDGQRQDSTLPRGRMLGETGVIKHICQVNKGPLNNDVVQRIFEQIIKECKKIEK